jgi:hypothetical protein
VRGELRVEMKDWQTCQLNTAGGFPKSFRCGAATRTTTHVTHRNCQLLHSTAEHSSDAVESVHKRIAIQHDAAAMLR